MRIKKYPRGILFLIFLVTFAVGTARGEDVLVQSQDSFGESRKAVETLFAAYSKYTRGSFEDAVSQNFISGAGMDYLNQVEKGFYAGPLISLDFFIERADQKKEKLAVNLQWNKRQMSYGAGQVKLLSGAVEMVFYKEKGKWKLAQVKGEDPLTTI